MKTKILLCQTTSSMLPEENLSKAKRILKKASDTDAQFVVFPEYFMAYYPSDSYVDLAESVEGSFVQGMCQLAKEHQIWILFGCNEKSIDETERCYNTILLVSNQGEIRGSYRKTHLFDAFSFQESKDTIPGETYFSPTSSPFGKIGIGTCYDLRFPEIARYEAKYGCEIMCYPSAWVKGENKYNQWKTLLKARAIENGMFVIGCCHYSDRMYMGRSLVVNPSGHVVAEGFEKEELISCTIDTIEVKKARDLVPVFRHLRKEFGE